MTIIILYRIVALSTYVPAVRVLDHVRFAPYGRLPA